MLFLLLTASAASAAPLLAVLRVAAALLRAATMLFVAGDAVTRSKLDFQLDDFVPLFVGAITLGNRQQFAEATPRINLRRYGRLSLGRVFRKVFWIGIVHWKLKSGAHRWRTPHSKNAEITFSWQRFFWRQRKP